MDRLSPSTACSSTSEDGVTHMHIASCAIFEGPAPAYDEFVAMVAGRLPVLPRYRQKVRFVPGSVGRPVWVDDPHFNLAYHLRHTALPPPGSEQELERPDGSAHVGRARPPPAALGGVDGRGPHRGAVGGDLEGPPLHGRRRLRHRPDGAAARPEPRASRRRCRTRGRRGPSRPIPSSRSMHSSSSPAGRPSSCGPYGPRFGRPGRRRCHACGTRSAGCSPTGRTCAPRRRCPSRAPSARIGGGRQPARASTRSGRSAPASAGASTTSCSPPSPARSETCSWPAVTRSTAS